jgi:hypothetical protein
MRRITARIPAGALHQRAVQTLDLLRAAQTRASVLRSQLGCTCLDSTRSDQLGPLPCSGPCTSRSAGTSPKPHPSRPGTRPGTGAPHRTGSPASSPAPGASTSAKAPGVTTSGPGGKTSQPVSRPSSPAGGSTSTFPIPPPSSLPVPTLPGVGGGKNGSSHPAVGISSCGASLNLGPIGIGVGGC